MISVQEAIQKVQQHAHKGAIGSVRLQNALNLVLAKDVYSIIDMPPFPQSAMDGYAVNFSEDIEQYVLIGEIQAGSSAQFDLKKGEAVRIFTGAAVPNSANMVVRQEDVQEQNKTISFIVPPIGSNIRPKAEQIQQGAIALSAGCELNPAAIGFLTSLGITEVDVYLPPKLGILTTGNELVRAGENLKYGQIYESNSLMLDAAFRSYGFTHIRHFQIEDDYQKTLNCITEAFETCDIVILSGGISVGDYDFVYKALIENGVEQLFYKVKQKPGKPLFFGKKAELLVFALPGNPAAALTSFYVYILPLLNVWIGKEFKGLSSAELPIAHDYQRKGDRTVILKGKYQKDGVHVLGGQSSAMLSSFATADGLIVIYNNQNEVKQGDLVQVLLF